MEESEDEAEDKAQVLMEKYKDKFLDIFATFHPKGIQGEIRGKGSNVAFAAREAIRRIGGPCANHVLTCMDADTCFASDYFAAVAYHYSQATEEDKRIMFFVPPSVFDRNALNVPFIVRAYDMVSLVWFMQAMVSWCDFIYVSWRSNHSSSFCM